VTLSRPTQPDLAETFEYVRQARRLRARYGHDLSQLHRSLSRLKPAPVRKPVQRRVDTLHDDATIAPNQNRATLARTVFASAVTEALDGPVLRYSIRLALLKQASRLGLGRFEANLVIAEVQHTQPRGEQVREERGRTSAGSWVVIALFVQALIGAGAYVLLFGI